MTNLAWILYLSDVAGNIQVLASLSAVGVVMVFVFGAAIHHIESGKLPTKKLTIKVILTVLGLVVFAALIPSTTAIKQMVGVTYAETIIRSPQMSDLTTPAMELAKEYMQSELKKLRAREGK